MSVLCVALNPTIDVACEADGVEPVHKIRTRDTQLYPGGGGVNVARVIAELGGAPSLLTMTGGPTGAVLDALLAELPIERRTVPIAGGSRIAFIAHDAASGLEYRFVPDGPAVTASELERLGTTFGAMLEATRPRWVVLSGSLPRDAPPDTYAMMARQARKAGARVAIDVSGPALRATLAGGGLDLVKPSLRELESLGGEKLDETGVRHAAEALVREGTAERVAVTLGMQGSLLATADGTFRRPALHVPVHSATGAGDSFVAGFVHALDRGADDEAAFALALATGAAAVMTPGTALCCRKDVERLVGPRTAALVGLSTEKAVDRAAAQAADAMASAAGVS